MEINYLSEKVDLDDATDVLADLSWIDLKPFNGPQVDTREVMGY